MSLMYPLCLLALLGVPVVILIYILKRHYTEQTVNSTYIWTLSEKFLKRRNPLSGLTGVISLILQILMILLIVFALVHPLITLEGKADEYCFVIDNSGSMNMQEGETTRFERGKDEIEKIINESVKGSKYTLISMGDSATTIYERTTSKETALQLLDELKPSYSGSDHGAAASVMQELFNEVPSTKNYLITDKIFQMKQNVEIINVKGEEDNIGITSLNAVCENGVIKISGILNSYKKQNTVVVDVYIDGSEAPVASATVVCPPESGMPAGVDTPFEIPPIKRESGTYSSVRAVIRNEDAMKEDNEAVVYNKESNSQSSILIVSKTPLFTEVVIDALGDYTVTTVTPAEYELHYLDRSFGLYIFDSYAPVNTPDDGAVWMINASGSSANSGVTYRSSVQLEETVRFEKSKSSSSLARKLLEGVDVSSAYLIKYIRYSTYTSYTPLFTTNGVPLIMAGENAYGNRSVVFAFDLHDSNIVMTGDFVNLIGNLLDYSFPSVVDKTSYFVGDSAIINTVANSDSIRVVTPLGNVKYLDTAQTLNELVLDEVGTYTVSVISGGTQRLYRLYSEMELEERMPTMVEDVYSIYGTPSNEHIDGEYDPLIIIFILLAVIFAADWMVYMYEKRQLR